MLFASDVVIRVTLEFRSKRRIWKCEECHFADAFSTAAAILVHWSEVFIEGFLPLRIFIDVNKICILNKVMGPNKKYNPTGYI
jgi:hypothetical protein